MRKDHLYEIKKAHYSSISTTLIIQSTICVIILLSIFVLKYVKPHIVDEINFYIHEVIEWETVWQFILQTKNTILYYIK